MHNSTENKSIVFDMDSTLTDSATIDKLARVAGVVSKVEEITKRAICGELDVCQALTKRVRLLKGLSLETAFDAVNHTCYMPGAALSLSTKSKGYRTAMNSCGLSFLLKR
jgi:phosphoserine phosphatase